MATQAPASTGMTHFDQAVHYLARQFYLEFCRVRDFPRVDPPPFTPRWANEYANIAVSYLGYDDEALTQLAKDYK